MKTEIILKALADLAAECPGCHGNLIAEPDSRMATGYAWSCPNPECSEHEGCWPVPTANIESVSRNLKPET